MHLGRRIVGNKRKRTLDQAGSFRTVALFQPEHAQQIRRGKNRRIDRQNLAVKLFGFRRPALLMQRQRLSSKDKYVPGFHPLQASALTEKPSGFSPASQRSHICM